MLVLAGRRSGKNQRKAKDQMKSGTIGEMSQSISNNIPHQRKIRPQLMRRWLISGAMVAVPSCFCIRKTSHSAA